MAVIHDVLLPTDRPRRRVAPRRTATESTAIAFTDELDSLAKTEEISREAVLHAAAVALLRRYTGQQSGDTLRDLVRQGGDTLSGTSELLITVYSGGQVEVAYDPSLFDAATVRRLLANYLTLLDAGVADPDLPVSLLRLLPLDEQHRILVDWNDTATDLPHEVCLHRAFEDRVARSPDAPALIHEYGSLTYRQVNVAANRLAHHLRALGVGLDTRVGLRLDRSPELVIGVLAVLKAGGAYVPLDPEYPANRLATMVAGAECALLVSRVELDRDAELIANSPTGNPEAGATPDDLCYVIYTSGSTGVPKPIALRHRGVANNLADLNSRHGVGPGDRVLGLSSPSFDMSVYEVLGMLTAGGTLVLPSVDRAKDPAHWAELVAAHGVTIWNSAPSLLDLLTTHVQDTGGGPLPTLRLAMVGGDWIPVALPDRVRTFAPALRFIALGGATESSIHSTLFEVAATDPDWTSIPYGRPMANQRTYILDEAGQPVPIGVPGDLHLAGTGLAREYLGQPDLTSERFTSWSHGPVTDERLYRTGDLARYRPDGVIELLGRLDFQVKIRGLRIELGEVEALLRAHPSVREAVVTAFTDAAADRYLVGYAVGEHLDTAELREHLAATLPAYMVPTVIVQLDALPLSPNGKLDRKALLEPTAATSDGDAPRDEWEQRVATVWQETLGIDRVSRDADFFAIGGDSMKAIRSMPKIDRTLKWADLYRHPTVKALAAHIRTTTTNQG